MRQVFGDPDEAYERGVSASIPFFYTKSLTWNITVEQLFR
jgi:hypothetical protein